MKTVMVTGANRGIGLELSRHILSGGDTLVALVRNESRAESLKNDLNEHNPDKLHIVTADLAEKGADDAIAHQLETTAVDWLINNAGVKIDGDSFFDDAALRDSLEVNVTGPLKVTGAALKSLKRGNDKRIINVSSVMGSIAKSGPGSMPYRVSKAALNMLTVQMAGKFKSDGITAVTIHPGWVATDMGGSSAPIPPSESAAAILELARGLTPSDSGSFLDASQSGAEIPW